MGDIQKAAATKQHPINVLGDNLERYAAPIERLLEGTGVSRTTFGAQIANVVRGNTSLLAAEPSSLIGAALRCAQLGLAPNDGRNLAWILPYKKNGVPQAQMQLGYGGVMELARRAVPGLRFDGRAVHPNDDFDIDYGRDQQLIHRPAVVKGLDRGGDSYAWYVRAIYPDGATQTHVLDREAVEYHRSFSKMKDSQMWQDSYDAGALKSVVLDMKRFLPASAQLAAALASDEQVIRVDDVKPVGDDDVLDVESSEVDDDEPEVTDQNERSNT